MKNFNVKLTTAFEHWWRFNVYMCVICLDDNSSQSDYISLVDEVYPIELSNIYHTIPQDYNFLRPLQITTKESHKIVVYLYVIANTLPSSRLVGDSPMFDASLVISSGEKTILDKTLKIDQLGGCTVAGLEISD